MEFVSKREDNVLIEEIGEDEALLVAQIGFSEKITT